MSVVVPAVRSRAARRPARHLWQARRILVHAVILVVVLGGWEGACRAFQIKYTVLPAPSRVLAALVSGLAESPSSRAGFWLHAQQTLTEALSGYVLGSLIGLLIGVLAAQTPAVGRLLMPYLLGLEAMPKIALAPLLIVWLGVGITSKIVLVTLLCIFPLAINALIGFESLEDERIDLMRSLSASGWDTFWLVRLPSALPFIFAGLEIALVYSLIGAIIGEFINAQIGLGAFILQMNQNLDMGGMFAVILLLSIIGVGLTTILRLARRRLLFWSQDEIRAGGETVGPAPSW